MVRNINITFKPKQVSKNLLSSLKDRAQYVVTKRFGLDGEDTMTLEAIGAKYGITRERVRQIENFALQAIRKSPAFKEEKAVFDEVKKIIFELGGIVKEADLLDIVASNSLIKKHFLLVLELGSEFTKHRESSFFHPRWSVDDHHAERVHMIIRDVHQGIKKHDLLSEKDIIDMVMRHEYIKDIHSDHRNEETIKSWLGITKALMPNPMNEWGHSDSANVRVRGVRDYAYLVMRNHGSPMHFREVAESIESTFNRPTHIATTHNELIKDNRFVLIGRGIYGLEDWGYKKGVVRDVIKQILSEDGPLSRDEIIDRVLKERYLKRNTILVNLQNPKHFVKDDNGLYRVA